MNSFIAWIGGKRHLRNEIVKRFPGEFGRYIEVFGGAAWVLFARDRHAEMEVYNDYDSELVNLFRCVKHHRPELQRELSFVLNSRELFHDFMEQYNTRGMTDIQRAARFFMLIKTSYGSNRSSFGCIKKNMQVMSEYLGRIEERLADVIIENKDFEDLISVYDKPNALLYLDPPYYGSERYYQAQFSQGDHERLRRVLEGVKGKFILSYNDCDYIRDLYSGFVIEEVSRQHNYMSRYDDKGKTYRELLITNYRS